MKSSAIQIAALVTALVCAAGVSLLAFGVVPSFEVMYRPFESELSLQTRLLFATFRWWSLLLLAVAYAWHVSATPHRAARSALLVGVGGATLLGAFGWWALQQSEIMLKLIQQSAT